LSVVSLPSVCHANWRPSRGTELCKRDSAKSRTSQVKRNRTPGSNRAFGQQHMRWWHPTLCADARNEVSMAIVLLRWTSDTIVGSRAAEKVQFKVCSEMESFSAAHREDRAPEKVGFDSPRCPNSFQELSYTASMGGNISPTPEGQRGGHRLWAKSEGFFYEFFLSADNSGIHRPLGSPAALRVGLPPRTSCVLPTSYRKPRLGDATNHPSRESNRAVLVEAETCP